MRGFPLINLLIVALLLSLMAVPLLMLARDSAPRVAAPSADATVSSSAARLRVRLVHAPEAAEVHQHGKLIHAWKFPQDGLELECGVEMDAAGKMLELEVVIRYTAGTPETVAEVTVTPEEFDEKWANVWGRGETRETLNFRW